MSGHPYLLLSLVSLGLGLLTGSVLYRADFCFAGMFRDLFLLRQGFMLRILLLLVAASMVLVELARLGGLLPVYPFPGLGPPAVTNLLGGMLFGTGMVLAGGCVVGTLYKMGSGRRASWLAFAGLIVGSSLYAEFHPLWAPFARRTRLGDALTLPQLLNAAPTGPLAVTVVLAGVLLWRWQRQGRLARPAAARGYLQPRSAALLLALVGPLSWWLVGMPLGITTAYAKFGAFFEQLLWPRHVAGLGYLKLQSLAVAAPGDGQLLEGGAGPAFDLVAAVQLPLIAGIVLAAFIHAWRFGELTSGGSLPVRQAVSAILGGLLMGLAARMAPACNVWHLLGGLPILALQSLLFTAGLFPGAWFGSRILSTQVIKP